MVATYAIRVILSFEYSVHAVSYMPHDLNVYSPHPGGNLLPVSAGQTCLQPLGHLCSCQDGALMPTSCKLLYIV